MGKPCDELSSRDAISIRDYVDLRFKEEAVIRDSKFAASEKATDLARQNMQVRLDGMNEWRHTVEDQANRFVTRVEFEEIKRIVYMGLGVAISIDLFLKFVVR